MGQKGVRKYYCKWKKINNYFKRPTHQLIVQRPLEVSNVLNNYDVKCSVKGGGLSGQAGAIILGISRALVLFFFFLVIFQQKILKKKNS